MQIKTQTVIPAHLITRVEPAPWSATCGPRDHMKVSGKQTRLPRAKRKKAVK
jgi:hypothetical protein